LWKTPRSNAKNIPTRIRNRIQKSVMKVLAIIVPAALDTILKVAFLAATPSGVVA
jgi:hypothetical protein